MRRRGVAACVAVVALLLTGVLGVGWNSSAATPPQVVRPGGVVVVHAGGFAPGGVVTVQLVGTTPRVHVRADRTGRISTTYRAPLRSGHYRLAVVGASPGAKPPTPTPGRGPGDHQVIEVMVPRLVLLAFVVRVPGRPSSGVGGGQTSGRPGHGAGGESASGGAGGLATSSGGARGNPAITGTDIGLLVLVAVALLGGGAAAARGGRRPRRG